MPRRLDELVTENAATVVTVLPPELFFISAFLSSLKSRTYLYSQVRVRTSTVYMLAVCR